LQVAEMGVSSKFGPYYEVKGTTSVYNPRVSKGQMSLSHVWVQSRGENKISAGWQVSFNFIIIYPFSSKYYSKKNYSISVYLMI